MISKFNYESIYLLAGGDVTSILKFYFKLKNLPASPNFIVNDEIIRKRRVNPRYRAEYLGLCSLRKYSEYLSDGITYLHRDLVPNYVPLDIIIANNPLITTESNKIILKGETK